MNRAEQEVIGRLVMLALLTDSETEQVRGALAASPDPAVREALARAAELTGNRAGATVQTRGTLLAIPPGADAAYQALDQAARDVMDARPQKGGDEDVSSE